MTPATLARIGTLMYGEDFAPRLAIDVGSSARNIRRYVRGDRRVPAWMPGRIEVAATRRVKELSAMVEELQAESGI